MPRKPHTPPPAPEVGEPVGAIEVADRLGVKLQSVHAMLVRGVLPPPDYESVNGSRAWEWKTILRWAGDTGRARTPELVNAYEATFRDKPRPPRKGGRISKEPTSEDP